MTNSVLRVKKCGEGVVAKQKADFCVEGRKDYIQKVLTFTFKHINCMAIARSTGLIQLYEDNCPDQNLKKKNFVLSKEWKKSNNGVDEIVNLGFFDNRYLYSCLSGGKLVFRDLVNDDADESYKVYMIDGPVSTVFVLSVSRDRVKVIATGKNNELKVYEVELLHSVPNLLALINEDIQTLSNGLRGTIFLPDHVGARELLWIPNLRSLLRLKLVPKFTSLSRTEDYIYKASPFEVLVSWFVSVCELKQRSMVACGSQFGNLVFYNISKDKYPIKVLHLSQFPINTLMPFGRYLIYTDTMSKVGVIDLDTFEIVNFYDGLEFGPTMSMRVVVSPSVGYVRGRFFPVYLMASTLDGRIVIYELQDNNEVSTKLNVQLDTLVPDLDILDYGSHYKRLYELFHESRLVPYKKRRMLTGAAGVTAK